MTPTARQALVERLERVAARYAGAAEYPLDFHPEHCALLDLIGDVLALLRADEAEPEMLLGGPSLPCVYCGELTQRRVRVPLCLSCHKTPAPSRPAGGAVKPAVKRLEEIREEHYPLMVSTLQTYVRLHGDPAIVARALEEAAREELAWARERKEKPDA